ncbi:MAG: PEP-CTERM sorting domain-containing protein [Gammaproteobacteria bacterium]
MKASTLLLAGAALAGMALCISPAQATPTPQTGVCPAIGTLSTTDCNVEIFAGSGGSFTTIGPNLSSPYDGVEDTLVGIVNNSGNTISSLTFNGSCFFCFDGDGLQYYGSGLGSDPTGYGGLTSLGENTSFTNIIGWDTGTVVFGSSGIPDGGWAYFSLEEAPSINIRPVSVPEPGSLVLFGLGLLGLVFLARRRGRSV